MLYSPVLQSVFLSLTTLTYAAQLTVSLPPAPPLLPNPATLPPSTHATLVGPPGISHDARLTRSNVLDFKNLTPGSYLLNIYTHEYSFAPYRVDVTTGEAGEDGVAGEEVVEVWQTFRGNEWSNKGPKRGEARDHLVVELRPGSKKDFYQTRGGFNIIGFLKSPMILMALVSCGMIFGLPYLMENMDPEAKAEFDEMASKGPLSGSQGATNAIQNFDLAGWMAGKTSDTSISQTSSGGRASGGKSLR